MSLGWLLLPFSELVLSSLSRLFVLGVGHGLGLYTVVTRGVAASLSSPACVLLPQPHFTYPGCVDRHAADLGSAVDPLVSWKQSMFKEGSFFPLLPAIHKYEAS